MCFSNICLKDEGLDRNFKRGFIIIAHQLAANIPSLETVNMKHSRDLNITLIKTFTRH